MQYLRTLKGACNGIVTDFRPLYMVKSTYKELRGNWNLDDLFEFYMPTRIVSGTNCLNEKSRYLKNLGKKALIVTGEQSSKLNGSLDDAIEALEKENIGYKIFDKVDDNPTIDLIQNVFDENEREPIDFVLGIGKGAPIDAAKAIGVLFRNRGITAVEAFNMKNLKSIPIAAVPTSAGSGSETTPFSIISDPILRTKKDLGQESFPKVAYLDSRYVLNTSFDEMMVNGFDAFSHLVEGYLNKSSSLLSDTLAERGFMIFGGLMNSFSKKELSQSDRENLLIASSLGGMVIAQTGTNLPHALGYILTYEKGMPHGYATAAIYKGYLEIYEDSQKLKKMLAILGFPNTRALTDFIDQTVPYKLKLSEAEISQFTNRMLINQGKLKNRPDKASKDQISAMYRRAIR